jgi:gamma-glutamyltranspeptidase/glutathione hydrolase
MALRDGRPVLVFGSMGGEGQPQTQAAVLTRIIDFGLGVQGAIEAPRWRYGRTWGQTQRSLKLESRIGDVVAADLRRRGHDVDLVGPWAAEMGHAQAIAIDPGAGLLTGGADPRGEGAALGW